MKKLICVMCLLILFNVVKGQKLLDFYYSPSQEKILKSFSKVTMYFKDKIYTESVSVGHKPLGNFKDYIFLGRGTSNDSHSIYMYANNNQDTLIHPPPHNNAAITSSKLIPPPYNADSERVQKFLQKMQDSSTSFASVDTSNKKYLGDTIRVVLLVSDTSEQQGYQKGSNSTIGYYKTETLWMNGYMINEKNSQFLDEDKKPLSKNIIVWQSTKSK